MTCFNFNDPEWPVFAALAWIAARDPGEVEGVCNLLPKDAGGAALDAIISKRASAGKENQYDNSQGVMKGFLYRAKEEDLSITGRRNAGERESIPIVGVDFWMWFGDDHQLRISFFRDASVVWDDLFCGRAAALRCWPARDASNDTMKSQPLLAPPGYMTFPDAKLRFRREIFGAASPEDDFVNLDAILANDDPMRSQLILERQTDRDGPDPWQKSQAVKLLLFWLLQTGAVKAYTGNNFQVISQYYWCTDNAADSYETGLFDGSPLYFLDQNIMTPCDTAAGLATLKRLKENGQIHYVVDAQGNVETVDGPAKSEDSRKPRETPASPPQRRGARPKYDWESCFAHLDGLFAYHGELSKDDPAWGVQADVERAALEFFQGKAGHSPSEAYCRQKISEYLRGR